jgi:hypothetical protein
VTQGAVACGGSFFLTLDEPAPVVAVNVVIYHNADVGEVVKAIFGDLCRPLVSTA